jgi:hypothetical protein
VICTAGEFEFWGYTLGLHNLFVDVRTLYGSMTCFTRYAQDKTVRTTVREGGSSEAAGSTKEVFGMGSGLTFWHRNLTFKF